jgi:hypothetical protein
MSTMKSKGRAQTGADPESKPPPEVIDPLAGLLPERAPEDAASEIARTRRLWIGFARY